MAPEAPDAKRILFVHNTTKPERDLEGVFKELNYEVVSATSFKDGSDVLNRGNVHLILASAGGNAQGLDFCTTARKQTKTKNVPVIVLSSASNAQQEFSAHQEQKGKADVYMQLPAPAEDLVDWVERLIGLPSSPSPNGHSELSPLDPTEIAFLRGQVEDLQTQLQGFQQPGVDVSSPSVKRSTQDMEQLLNELQEDSEKLRHEKTLLRDEIQMLKGELAQKERDLHKKDFTVDEAKEEATRQNMELKQQLDELRATLDEADQKHKKAQNALREYYKPKIGQNTKLEKKLSTLESEVQVLRDAVAPLKKENEQLKEEVVKERAKAEQAKVLLSSAAKLFSS